MKRLKIAYVTTYDARDVRNWSGLGSYIATTLEKHIGDVEYVDKLETERFVRNYFLKAYNRFMQKGNFRSERTSLVGEHYASQINKRIAGKKFDLIFSPGTMPIAYLDTKIPIVFWTDSTFASMVGYYFKNICPTSVRDGLKMEKLALERARLAVYSSEWASSSAVRDFGVSRQKVMTIPFGANLDAPFKITRKRLKNGEQIKLLFVGRDWIRKGGSIAVETFRAIQSVGVDAQLTIVGTDPGIREKGIKIYPFLDKNKTEDRQLLAKLYTDSHFFILPTRQEAYGVVLCEASSFGLPVLATNTGGVPTIVKDRVNGYLLPLEAGGNEYAAKITQIVKSGTYPELSLCGRRRYDELLNWDRAGQSLKSEILARL